MARKRLTVIDLFMELNRLIDEGIEDEMITVRSLHTGTFVGVEGIGFDKATGKVILYVSDGE